MVAKGLDRFHQTTITTYILFPRIHTLSLGKIKLPERSESERVMSQKQSKSSLTYCGTAGVFVLTLKCVFAYFARIFED